MLREFADHFVENHSSRIMTDCRNRHSRVSYKDPQTDLIREEIILYLEKLRDKAEREGPKIPSRRTQETQTLPTSLSPATSNFLLQELPSTSAPQHLQPVSESIVFLIDRIFLFIYIRFLFTFNKNVFFFFNFFRDTLQNGSTC